MKKIVLWLMSTLTVLVLLFGYHTSTSSRHAASGRVVGGRAGQRQHRRRAVRLAARPRQRADGPGLSVAGARPAPAATRR